jgi:hypothetical protein
MVVHFLRGNSELSMDDLAGLGKATEKFFGLIESAIGTLYRPRAIRKEGEASADAEAYKIVAIANANAKADIVKFESQQDLERRAIDRLRQQELTKQTNIESIVEEAAKEIGTSDVNEAADKDWLNYFFDACSGVSNREVQQFWARVLARQVVSDRGLSRKLIDCLRWIDRGLANEFVALAPRIFYFHGFFSDEVGLTKDEIRYFGFPFRSEALEEVGLLRENLSKTFDFAFQSLSIDCVELSDRALEGRHFYDFSTAGRELAETVCDPIIQFRKKLSVLRPDPVSQVGRWLGHGPYLDADSRLDSIIFRADERAKLAASHITKFLIQIAAKVVIRKALLTKDKLVSSRPIMTITKKTPTSLSIKRESSGPYVQELHPTERKFLDRLERLIEANRDMICNEASVEASRFEIARS